MHSSTQMNDEGKEKAGKQEGIINMAKDDIYFPLKIRMLRNIQMTNIPLSQISMTRALRRILQ